MTIYGDGNCCECGEVLKFEKDGWTHICPKCGKKYRRIHRSHFFEEFDAEPHLLT